MLQPAPKACRQNGQTQPQAPGESPNVAPEEARGFTSHYPPITLQCSLHSGNAVLTLGLLWLWKGPWIQFHLRYLRSHLAGHHHHCHFYFVWEIGLGGPFVLGRKGIYNELKLVCTAELHAGPTSSTEYLSSAFPRADSRKVLELVFYALTVHRHLYLSLW